MQTGQFQVYLRKYAQFYSILKSLSSHRIEEHTFPIFPFIELMPEQVPSGKPVPEPLPYGQGRMLSHRIAGCFRYLDVDVLIPWDGCEENLLSQNLGQYPFLQISLSCGIAVKRFHLHLKQLLKWDRVMKTFCRLSSVGRAVDL